MSQEAAQAYLLEIDFLWWQELDFGEGWVG